MPPNEMRVSQYFKLPYSQPELDFVDVPVHNDIQLYVDPFALGLQPDIWFKVCHNLVVGYFQELIDCIKQKRQSRAVELLHGCREPPEVHLGESDGHTRGRGIGPIQAVRLYQRLARSRAIQSGKLRDLADCELFIPQISSDKISDLTVNVIRRLLLEYTQEQCRTYNIPMSRRPIPPMWDENRRAWRSDFGEAPSINGELLLLVPKVAVRYRLGLDSHEYYTHFVVNFLQAENLSANSSLVETLKNGKKVVRKQDIKDKYPLSIDFLAEFTEEHPKVLEAYKKKAKDNAAPAPSNDGIEDRQRRPATFDPNALIKKLRSIPKGAKAATEYHDTVFGILQVLFYPSLWKPRKEEKLDGGQKRVDIIFNNNARSGFFAALANVHRVQCPYVFAECKNYSTDPENPEIDQLLGRFDEKAGMFGILTCRDVKDTKLLHKRLRAPAQKGKGFIVVLTDEDLIGCLEELPMNRPDYVSNLLDDRFRELIL
jgi:hypothetical protein